MEKIKRVSIKKHNNKSYVCVEDVNVDTAIVDTLYSGLQLMMDTKRYSNGRFKRYAQKWQAR